MKLNCGACAVPFLLRHGEPLRRFGDVFDRRGGPFHGILFIKHILLDFGVRDLAGAYERGLCLGNEASG